jgi:glycosyltransferase A (GT-A) superfamily protein (DUF2064 family)
MLPNHKTAHSCGSDMPSQTPDSKPTLVIFCKRPLPAQGKQRLAATLGQHSAFRVASALLDCALEDAAAWGGSVVLSISSKKDKRWAESLLSRPHEVLVQSAGNLGARINAMDQHLRARGEEQLVFIGTDAPMLTNQHYQCTLEALASHDLALSHAEDGGVVIMANNRPWPDIQRLPWSTNKLGLALTEQCITQGLTLKPIKPGYDIDTEQDLAKLASSLSRDQRPARVALLKLVKDRLV